MSISDKVPENNNQQPDENKDPNAWHENSQGSPKGNGRNNQRDRVNTSIQAYNWTGQNKDIGGILTLRPERFQNKVVYSEFIEKMTN